VAGRQGCARARFVLELCADGETQAGAGCSVGFGHLADCVSRRRPLLVMSAKMSVCFVGGPTGNLGVVFQGQAIPVFVSSLARRQDRLQRIQAYLGKRNIQFERIDACDGQAAAESALDEACADDGPTGMVGPGVRACTASHFWRGYPLWQDPRVTQRFWRTT